MDHVAAQHLFANCGFHNQGIQYASVINRGKILDHYHNIIIEEEFMININRIHVCGGLRNIFSPFVSSSMRWAI